MQRAMPSRQRSCLTSLACALLTASLSATATRAQVARVASVEHVTEKKTGATGAWRSAGPGVPLSVDDRLRTGKRSKADVKFTDGSLLRLGQLSSVTIRSEKGVQISSGQVLAVMLQPGRVLAGTATAEIKGSIAIIRQNPDGTYTFELQAGRMTVIAPHGTVDVRPGKGVTARADGSLTTLFNIPPLLYQGGTLRSELTSAPQHQVVYAGSPANVRDRFSPARVAVDENRQAQEPAVILANTNPFRPPTRSPTTVPPSPLPLPLPFPTLAKPVPNPFPTVLAPTTAVSVAQGVSLGRREYQLAGPGAGPTTDSQVQALNAAQQTAELDTTAAQNHFNAANPAVGSGSGLDAELLAAISTGGDSSAQAYGGRLHGFSANGHWFLDLAATPLYLRSRTPGPGYSTSNYSAISNATLTYRQHSGEVQIGRQRFVEGPTQAALFGSLVRQGGREIMDAVRFSPNIGANRHLEVAYLYDAYPRNLPYRVPGAQHGLYGRFAVQEKFGNFGVNVINYRNTGLSSTTGATVDFAVPLVRNQIEFYGEAGRDTFRRNLTTVGLTFPGLYDRTNLDAYLEYAHLHSSSVLAAPPNELALRVYRKFGRYTNIVAGISKFSKLSTNFTLGLAVGGSLYGDSQEGR